jgi:hypothetical protein
MPPISAQGKRVSVHSSVLAGLLTDALGRTLPKAAHQVRVVEISVDAIGVGVGDDYERHEVAAPGQHLVALADSLAVEERPIRGLVVQPRHSPAVGLGCLDNDVHARDVRVCYEHLDSNAHSL